MDVLTQASDYTDYHWGMWGWEEGAFVWVSVSRNNPSDSHMSSHHPDIRSLRENKEDLRYSSFHIEQCQTTKYRSPK